MTSVRQDSLASLLFQEMTCSISLLSVDAASNRTIRPSSGPYVHLHPFSLIQKVAGNVLIDHKGYAAGWCDSDQVGNHPFIEPWEALVSEDNDRQETDKYHIEPNEY